MKKRIVVDSVLWCVFLTIVTLGFILETTYFIIHNIRIDNKINKPENCLEINDNYYCRVEAE